MATTYKKLKYDNSECAVQYAYEAGKATCDSNGKEIASTYYDKNSGLMLCESYGSNTEIEVNLTARQYGCEFEITKNAADNIAVYGFVSGVGWRYIFPKDNNIGSIFINCADGTLYGFAHTRNGQTWYVSNNYNQYTRIIIQGEFFEIKAYHTPLRYKEIHYQSISEILTQKTFESISATGNDYTTTTFKTN